MASCTAKLPSTKDGGERWSSCCIGFAFIKLRYFCLLQSGWPLVSCYLFCYVYPVGQRCHRRSLCWFGSVTWLEKDVLGWGLTWCKMLFFPSEFGCWSPWQMASWSDSNCREEGRKLYWAVVPAVIFLI